MTSISDINNYHDLVTVKVRPEQLVLDPTNPRINVDVDTDHTYTDEELLSDAVQKDILGKINLDEYRVSDLRRGIERQGFIAGTGPLIVERIGDTNKYLVLEGNRRTTAIKSLLAEKDKLNESVLRTLEIIEVKEFRYKENVFFEKDEIVDILLGTIHITGPVGWGAMEKAYYIYKTYVRELERASIRSGLRIDEECVTKLSGFFNCSKADIRKSVWVYSVYQQLVRQNYAADSKKFTLIELAIADRSMRKNYFEMDKTCTFSELGLERFSNLCLEADCPIKNPQDFQSFKYVRRNGSESNIAEIENRAVELDLVYKHVKESKEESKILDELTDILGRLRALNVAGFADDIDERRVIKQISEVVQNKLVAIVDDTQDEDQDDHELEDWYLPTNVSELKALTSWQVREIIKEALKTRPNSTCVRDKLPTYALRYLEIRTTGGPREEAVGHLNGELTSMIESGLVQAYKTGKNHRVRLLVD